MNVTGTLVDLTKVASNNFQGISVFTDESQTEFRQLTDYLKDIAEIYDELDASTQNTLLQTLFGKTRASVGAAIIQNIDAVDASLEVMENSAGAADAEMAIITDSIEYHTNAMSEAWVGLQQTLVNSDEIKSVVDVFTAIINGANNVVSAFGAVNLAAGALGTVLANKLNLNLISYDKDNGFSTLFTGLVKLPNITQQAKQGIQELINTQTGLSAWSTQFGTDVEGLAKSVGVTDKQFSAWLQTVQESGTTYTSAESAIAGYQQYLKTAGNEAVIATLKTNLLTAATKLLSSTLTMIAFTALSKGISLIVSKIQDYINRVEIANQAMSDAQSEFDDTTSEVESLTSELEECHDRLKELQDLADNGELTIADEQELETLQKQNNELERQLALQKEKQRLDAVELANATRQAMTVTSASNYSQGQEIVDSFSGAGTGTYGVVYNTQSQELVAAAEKANELQDAIDAINDKWADIDWGSMDEADVEGQIAAWNADQAQIEEYEAEIENIRSDMVDFASTMSDAIDNYNALEEATGDLSEADAELRDEAQSAYDVYSDTIDRLDNVTDVLEDVADATEDAVEELSYTLNDLFALEDEEGNATLLGNLNDQLDNIQNAYSKLSSAMDTYSESGAITIDQLQDIIALGDDWLDYLTLEDGALGVNEDAMYDLAAARLAEMKAQVEQTLINNVQKLYSEADAAKYLTSTNYDLADSYETVAASALDAWKAEAVANTDMSKGTILQVYDKAVSDFNKIEELFNNISLTPTSLKGGSSSSSSSSKSSGSSGSSSSTATEYEQEIDFFTTRITRLSDAYELLETNIENVIGANAKNTLVDAQYDIAAEKVNNYTDALAMYQEMANKALANIPTEYIDDVVNGSVKITDFVGEANESVVDAINDYNDWADKIADCQANLAELEKTMRQLELEKFNNIIEQYNNLYDLYETGNDNIQKQIDLLEEAGEVIGESFYTTLIEQTNKQIDLLTEERTELSKELSSALSSGKIKEGTDEWYEMVTALQELDGEILDAKKSVEEFDNAILELHWDTVDRVADAFSNISDEIDNIIGLLENDGDVVDEFGNWTSAGITQLGLYAQQYELAKYEVAMYADEIEDLNKAYAEGKYSATEYAEKLVELNDAQWDAVNAAEDAQQAILSLNETRVKAITTALQAEIDAYSDLTKAAIKELTAEEELYNRRQEMAEKTKAVEDIEKQIAALSGDTSLSGQAKLAQLYEDLANAQQDLADTEFSYSIEDQTDALNDALDQFTAIKEAEIDTWEEYLTNTDQVLIDSFEAAQTSAEEIYQELSDLAQEHGVIISETITSAWQAGEDAINSYSVYLQAADADNQALLAESTANARDMWASTSSAFIANIVDVEGQVYQLDDDANVTADSLAYMFATKADTLVSELQSSYSSAENVNTMTNALKSSLVDTLERGYDISGIKSNLDSIVSSLNSVTSAANSAAKAISSVGDGDTGTTTSSSGGGAGTQLMARYASGTKHAKKGWATVDEEGVGSELIIDKDTKGRYRFMSGDETVYPKDATDNLWGYSTISPDDLIAKAGNIAADRLQMPSVGSYEVNNQSPTTMSVGNMVTINANKIDEDSLPMIQNVVNDTVTNAFKRVTKEVKKRGG